MDQNRPQVNRLLVGIIAIVCLAIGIAIAVQDSPNNFWCGGFVRVGVLMSVFWFCLPTKGRPAAWANVSPWWIVGLAALLLLVRRTQILIPIGIAFLFLGVLLPMLTRPRK